MAYVASTCLLAATDSPLQLCYHHIKLNLKYLAHGLGVSRVQYNEVSSSNLTMLQLSILWLVMGVASGDRCVWHQVGRRQSEKRGWLVPLYLSGSGLLNDSSYW
jgi:hypothetical protein